jgi:putative Ca2+/H+ antiporter (TMEM165/GDT1 family)
MFQTALTAFGLIFLAELGDKTQLAVLALASRSTSPWGVFIGAGSALLVTTLIAVLLGCNLPRIMPDSATRIVHIVAGAMFIVIGAWTIWKAA